MNTIRPHIVHGFVTFTATFTLIVLKAYYSTKTKNQETKEETKEKTKK